MSTSTAATTGLSDETLADIASLGAEIVQRQVTSTADMNRKVAEIAESAGVRATEIFDLLGRHILQKFPMLHPSLNTDAFVALMRFRIK